MGEKSADVLICGAGIIGLTIARELVRRGCERVILLEKEETLGRHASGRNSGVLHAGIYYAFGTLRAQSCLRGNLLMKQYCREKGLPLVESGKVIVARNEREADTLRELYRRAKSNGARAEFIDEKELDRIEPYAKTCGTALYAYDTAVVDPRAVLQSLHDDLVSSGKVTILFGTSFLGVRGSTTAVVQGGTIRFGTFINAAGAQSDRVAHRFGVGANYKFIPFKGIYKRLRNTKSNMVRGNIYPAPDLRNPFLGVHFTKSVTGEVYIGPTAMPALGRENYGALRGIDWEAVSILLREAFLLMVNPEFRETAFSESRKYRRRFFLEAARSLVKELDQEDILPSEKAGIRPQLIDWESRKLVQDFVVLRDGTSVHVLNAISPGFTSSMDFASWIIDHSLSSAQNPEAVDKGWPDIIR